MDNSKYGALWLHCISNFLFTCIPSGDKQDLSKMTEEELQFHYFKLHDNDDNNRLDGLELVKSLIHWHVEEHKHLQVVITHELVAQNNIATGQWLFNKLQIEKIKRNCWWQTQWKSWYKLNKKNKRKNELSVFT